MESIKHSDAWRVAAMLIQQFEGFSAKPYQCPAGVWTIGYGHTCGVNAKTPEVSRDDALKLLYEDIAEAEGVICNSVGIALNSNQLAALLSFVFNVGAGNFAQSTLLKKLNALDWKGTAAEFPRWVYSNGKRLNGLIARREAEKQLFLKEI